jgi:hypothetical protein
MFFQEIVPFIYGCWCQMQHLIIRVRNMVGFPKRILKHVCTQEYGDVVEQYFKHDHCAHSSSILVMSKLCTRGFVRIHPLGCSLSIHRLDHVGARCRARSLGKLIVRNWLKYV